jgi:hypothetical protein
MQLAQDGHGQRLGRVLGAAKACNLTLATAESCTAGAIAYARRTQSSAVGAPEVGGHGALEGAPLLSTHSELDGRQDCAHHRYRTGEVQDRDDEPWLQHPPPGSAQAGGGCARLSANRGGSGGVVQIARAVARQRQNGSRSGIHYARVMQPLAQLRQKLPKDGVIGRSLWIAEDFGCCASG